MGYRNPRTIFAIGLLILATFNAVAAPQDSGPGSQSSPVTVRFVNDTDAPIAINAVANDGGLSALFEVHPGTTSAAIAGAAGQHFQIQQNGAQYPPTVLNTQAATIQSYSGNQWQAETEVETKNHRSGMCNCIID